MPLNLCRELQKFREKFLSFGLWDLIDVSNEFIQIPWFLFKNSESSSYCQLTITLVSFD